MWGEHVSSIDLFSFSARQGLATLSFLEYMAVFVVLLVWVRLAESRRQMPASDPRIRV
jgi:hypothetical protein